MLSRSYDAELAKQQAHDALCREFAGVADPFSKAIDADKDKITKSQDDLENQVAHVSQRTAAVSADNSHEHKTLHTIKVGSTTCTVL